MKRLIAVGTGVVVLLAGAVGAEATANIDSGTYKGKVSKRNPQTHKRPPVTFKVTKGKKLAHFTVKGLYMKCSDGDHFTITDKLDSGRKRLNILDNGKFAFTVTYKQSGGKWAVNGRITGHKAKGTMKMTVRFNSDNKPDPNGNIVCRSGKLKWAAKH